MTADGVDTFLDSLTEIIIKSSPPATVIGMTLLGLTLHQWVYVVTIIYTLVATAALIKRYWFDKQESKHDKNR